MADENSPAQPQGTNETTPPELPPLIITPPTDWQPAPGDQYPAAVLPQSPDQSAVPVSAQIPGGPAGKPRNKLMIVTIALAVVFVLAAGAFSALWIAEKGAHQGTSSELQTVRKELATTAQDLASTEKMRQLEARGKDSALREAAAYRTCAEAAKELLESFTEAEFDKNFDKVVTNC